MKVFALKKTMLLSLCALSLMAMAAAGPLLIHAARSHDECTSWIALGPAISGNKTLLHKNRDLSDDDPDHHQFRKINTGLYKYIAMTDDKDADALNVWGGVNEAGLAAASNLGSGVNLLGTIGGPAACREILENCASVQCAYDWIAANKARFFYENIMFFADSQKGAVVEVRINTYGTVSITTAAQSIFDADTVTVTGKAGLNFRSNHFKILSNVWGVSDNSEDRYERLLQTLAKTPEEATEGHYGTINVAVSQDVGSLPSTAGYEDAFCRTSTLGRMTFEIDGDYPLDSVMYHGNGYEDEYGNIVACDQTSPDIHRFDSNPIVTYDFVGVVPANTHANVYACDVDQFPFGGVTSNLNSKTEATAGAYINIGLADDLVWTTAKAGSYDEMMLWVETTVQEAPADILRIEFVFQGYSSEGNDFAIYVKKAAGAWQEDSSWVQLGTIKSFTANKFKSIRRALETNIGEYMDAGGKIVWMVGAPEGHDDSLTTNVVKAEIVLR